MTDHVPTPSRKVRRKRAAKPHLQFTNLPTVGDWYASFSSPFCFVEIQDLLNLRWSAENQDPPPRRMTLEDYLRPLEGSSLPGIEAFREHLKEKYRRNCRPNTLTGTLTAVRMFLSFLRERGKTRIDEMEREDVDAWVEHEQDRGISAVSVRSRLTVLHAFVVFLVREGVVSEQLLSRWIRIKTPELLPRAMDPEDVKQLLGVLTGTRKRAMILVLLRTGMRIGELLGSKVQDVHLAERRIDIPRAPKTGVGRVAYLSDDARESLQSWFEKRDKEGTFLFYGQGRSPLSYAAARLVFKKLLVKAGLQDRGYTVHCLRHTFATEMLNAGMRLECVQELLGHSSILVTRRYARLSDVTREDEYFRAMEQIEQGRTHAHFQLDPELQAIFEEKKLLRPNGKTLSE
jgi:site-specific recombinase XerD